MLQIEPLELASVDWNAMEYAGGRNFCQGPVWLNFLAATQHGQPLLAVLRDSSSIAGYFAGMVVQKFGFKILGSPFPGWSTPYMGFNLRPDVDKREALRTLTRFAFTRLNCMHVEIMDRNISTHDLEGSSCRYRLFSGYEIDLTRSEDEIFGSMTSACRRCIRKAEKSGVTVEVAEDHDKFVDEYYAQLTDVFAKQRLVPTYDANRVRLLVEHLAPTNTLLLIRARDPQGRSIATGIFPAISDTTAYFWGMASWRDHQILRPNEALLWYAMRHWKARGVSRFDMGGGGEYKKKYGGAEISVPWLRVSKYALLETLRGTALNAAHLRQRVLGRWVADSRQASPGDAFRSGAK